MNRTPEEWAKVDAAAVVAGSNAQAHNVLKMALQDIASLTAERDCIERNRDMWREQCNRQADQLRGTRSMASHQGNCK
ncbi:hypothetical protein [Bradyrhizobium tunisiense]|uniref:hypothetical protein n=1 Tax=Bradyrhizobium tunisiense TaxID=3278709 RepID=UPI0035E2B7CD